jgi:hypothetical protein
VSILQLKSNAKVSLSATIILNLLQAMWWLLIRRKLWKSKAKLMSTHLLYHNVPAYTDPAFTVHGKTLKALID